MYKISVPLMNSTINEKNREKYLQLCKKAGASRIFLAIEENCVPATLKDNISFFKEYGFEVGVWTSTVGHGFQLAHTEVDGYKFKEIVDIEGSKRPNANCPLDENFREFTARLIADIAKLNPDIVMLDDDFRLSQHGEHLCCACDLHIDRISKILGERVTREEIKPFILSGKPNKYRDAWLKAQNESLIEFAKQIRAEVDKESSDVILCNCTAFCIWNVDGIDVPEIARTLGGKNKKILRLTGAPYWATGVRREYPLITVFEIARMLAFFVQNEGFELMSEGDAYPRPRYTCPASYLEMYDAATRISGDYDGILKYMFDYVAGPDFETGYLQAHQKNQTFYNQLEKLFPNGANSGVKIIARPHTMKNANLDLSPPRIYSPVPLDGTMFGQCGIPTIYKGRGICNSVFGENARDFDLNELANGTIIDGVSAMILHERGIDIGLKSVEKFVDKNIQFLATKNAEHKSLITDGEVKMLNAVIKEGAEPVLFASYGNETVPFAYKYENADCEKFLVFLFEAACIYNYSKSIAVTGLTKNYATQEVLIDTIPWLGGKNIPVYCEKNPELYLMCEQDENSMSVALFNCFADEVLNPIITLDKEYSNIECLNCEAKLEENKVILKSILNAYSMAAFKVFDYK